MVQRARVPKKGTGGVAVEEAHQRSREFLKVPRRDNETKDELCRRSRAVLHESATIHKLDKAAAGHGVGDAVY